MIRSPLMTVMTDAVMKASRSLKRDFGEVEVVERLYSWSLEKSLVERPLGQSDLERLRLIGGGKLR